MVINVSKKDDSANVNISGRLDTSTATDLESTVQELIADGAKSMVFDLKNLEYTSSAGLRVILKTHKQLSETGGLKLKNVNADIREILEITGFLGILTIE